MQGPCRTPLHTNPVPGIITVMKQTQLPPPSQTQLLIRFSVPLAVKCEEHAHAAATKLAEPQCWADGWELRKAKRYEDLRPDGSLWIKFEVWGRFDVAKLSAKVMQRLEEKAKEQVAEGSPQPKDAVSPLSEMVAKEDA